MVCLSFSAFIVDYDQLFLIQCIGKYLAKFLSEGILAESPLPDTNSLWDNPQLNSNSNETQY